MKKVRSNPTIFILILFYFVIFCSSSSLADSKLGIAINSKTMAVAQFNDISGNEDNSTAKKAGIRKGDIIKVVNGVAVNNVNEFRKVMKQTPPNIEIPIKIERQGKGKVVQVRTTKNFTPEVDIVFDALMNGNRVTLAIVIGNVSNTVALSNQANLNEWKKGIRVQLQTEVGGVYTQFKKIFKKFSLVTRDKIMEVLKELNFQSSGYIDPATREKIGKLTGATHILYIDFSRTPRKQKAHTDIISKRLINVVNGEVLSSVNVTQYYNSQGRLEKVE